MYKEAIEKMHLLQRMRLMSVSLKGNRLSLPSELCTKQSGLYWIYTTHSNDDLLNATPSTKKGSVNFANLVALHADLSKMCGDEVDGFRVVYNGIGGVGRCGGGGLRERILEEFRGGEGTGALAIRDSSVNTLANWRFSYVLWSEIEFDNPHKYQDFAEGIERLWRIHYGWPVLCTK